MRERLAAELPASAERKQHRGASQGARGVSREVQGDVF